jgi:hypothetical protein
MMRACSRRPSAVFDLLVAGVGRVQGVPVGVVVVDEVMLLIPSGNSETICRLDRATEWTWGISTTPKRCDHPCG